MTSCAIPKPLKIDRLELVYRFEPRNFFPVTFIRERLAAAIIENTARRIGYRIYPNSTSPAERVAIALRVKPRRVLVVETGMIEDNGGVIRSYAKFEFNVQKLVVDNPTRISFLETLSDFLPGGGYRELCEYGYVLYAEFAADFEGIDVASIDAFSELTETGQWFPKNAQRETISLGKHRGTREYSFSIYDKSKQEWKKEGRLRRRKITRIEAKRRLNHTKIYRELRLAELDTITNPFISLRIFDAEKIAQVLNAARHGNFLAIAQQRGVQAAFDGTRGGDRKRRLKMLERCRAIWWEPEAVWCGAGNAVREALELQQ